MIERVVENWLTSTNELDLQLPFCHLLAGEGHTVVHISRHGPFEQGKDVLSIGPDGVPCAFQLKSIVGGGRLTRTAFAEYRDQLEELVGLPIKHPAIDSSIPWRPYFVVNGMLDEEVREEIIGRNIVWKRRGLSPLDVVLRPELLMRFKRLQSNFWPVDLASEKALLDLYMADGRACLDKGRLSQFLLSILPLADAPLSAAKWRRALASAAVFATYAMASHSAAGNHVAQADAWLVYIACLIAVVDRHGLPERCWRDSLEIAVLGLRSALTALCEELKSGVSLVEGDALADRHFYRGRVTWLLGLVAAHGCWQWLEGGRESIDPWCRRFVDSHLKDIVLWGEAAIPQFLAVYWFLKETGGIKEADRLLLGLIRTVTSLNLEAGAAGLPDPYHGLAEIAARVSGVPEQDSSERYGGRSYCLESLIQLFARLGLRQHLASLWPDISRVMFASHTLEAAWQTCLWDAGEAGVLSTGFPTPTRSWTALQQQARTTDTKLIPRVLQAHPHLLLLFLIAYPHRLTANTAKYLDDCLRLGLPFGGTSQ